MAFCNTCGKEINDNAVVCVHCGCQIKGSTLQSSQGGVSKVVGILIVFFLGCLGVHRFMAGKTGTGVLWLLTAGLLGFGALYDLIMVCTDKFTDSNGEIWAKG